MLIKEQDMQCIFKTGIASNCRHKWMGILKFKHLNINLK